MSKATDKAELMLFVNLIMLRSNKGRIYIILSMHAKHH